VRSRVYRSVRPGSPALRWNCEYIRAAFATLVTFSIRRDYGSGIVRASRFQVLSQHRVLFMRHCREPSPLSNEINSAPSRLRYRCILAYFGFTLLNSICVSITPRAAKNAAWRVAGMICVLHRLGTCRFSPHELFNRADRYRKRAYRAEMAPVRFRIGRFSGGQVASISA